jgi:hypothetical protein
MSKLFIALLISGLLLAALGIKSGEDLTGAGCLPLRAGLSRSDRVTVNINETNLSQAFITYSELTGRTQIPKTSPLSQRVDEFFGGYLSRRHLLKPAPRVPTGIEYHRDGLFSVGEVKDQLEALFAANDLVLTSEGKKYFRAVRSSKPTSRPESL